MALDSPDDLGCCFRGASSSSQALCGLTRSVKVSYGVTDPHWRVLEDGSGGRENHMGMKLSSERFLSFD